MNRNARRKEQKIQQNSGNIPSQGDANAALEQVWQLHNQRNFLAAEALCKQVLEAHPQNPDAWNFMGSICREQGRVEEAVGCFSRALAINPSYYRALFNLANIMLAQKDYPRAIELLRYTLQHKPDHTEAMMRLSDAYLQLHRGEEAVHWAKQILYLQPEESASWQTFYSAFMTTSFKPSPDTDFENFLVASLSLPSRYNQMMYSCVLVYCQYVLPGVLHYFQLGSNNVIAEIAKHIESGAVETVFQHPLLEGILRHMAFPALGMECFMRHARSIYTERVLSREMPPSGSHSFLLTLAYQCQLNEHVYYCDAQDKKNHRILLERLKGVTPSLTDEFIVLMLLLASYQKIHLEPWAEKLSSLALDSSSTPLTQFIREFVTNALEENVIRDQIQALTPIREGVSSAVREQYEENPYPRWRYACRTTPLPVSDVFRIVCPFFDHARLCVQSQPHLLIAGCGTGMNSIHTSGRFQGATTLAIDLSLTSLSYAIRKTKENGITNITYKQADIMELDSVPGEFDIVESSGVLHHLEFPLKGWEILTRKVKSGGVMKISLYSHIARQAINEIRKNISIQDRKDDAESIRNFRYELMELPLDGQIEPIFRIRDFYDLSQCRDLLFHRQEHQFTLLEIKEALKRLGLEFMGFENSNLLIDKWYRERFPEDRAMNSLDNWHQFELENPRTFLGMYQFWCFKP